MNGHECPESHHGYLGAVKLVLGLHHGCHGLVKLVLGLYQGYLWNGHGCSKGEASVETLA